MSFASRISSSEAKSEFYLTPADLSGLHYTNFGGGIGCGALSRYYEISKVKACAIAKHGEAGLAKKLASRKKREANKRKREDEAAAYETQLLAGSALINSAAAAAVAAATDDGLVDLTGDEEVLIISSSIAAAAAVTGAVASPSASELKSVRTETRRALKKTCTWDYLRSKNAPNGTTATVRLERIDKVVYAALIGRAADPDLKSLVKSGAWYSTNVGFEAFFGTATAENIRGSGGRYGCNSDLGIDSNTDLTVKYSPSQATLSVGAWVSHIY